MTLVFELKDTITGAVKITEVDGNTPINRIAVTDEFVEINLIEIKR